MRQITHFASSSPTILFSDTPCSNSYVCGRSRAQVPRGRRADLVKAFMFKSLNGLVGHVPAFVSASVRSSLSESSSSSDGYLADEWGEKPAVADEWGEKDDPGPELGYPKSSESDPPMHEDEWEERDAGVENVSSEPTVPLGNEDNIEELKTLLVDTTYGTEFGFRASSEARAEILELVQRLEKLNPNKAPVEIPTVLDGAWVLLYTAYSELLPFLALSSVPLLNVEKITQSIDTSCLSIVNTITLASPISRLSFNASASFEVRSPSRIQVEFKEGSFLPPEINSAVSLPESVNIFGQNISLSPLQQSLSPLQDAVASIARTISGQPPLKLPIPGNRTQSWLLITYLDQDLRICRGDGGGLFVLAKEGSSLLDY